MNENEVKNAFDNIEQRHKKEIKMSKKIILLPKIIGLS